MKRGQFTTYTLDDPALGALTPTQAIKYASTRKAEDAPGIEDPCVFTFRRLTRAQRLFADSATTEAERYERAFLAGVLEVGAGFFAETADASPWRPEGLDKQTYVSMSADEREYLEEHLGPAAIVDVGMVIYVRSWLRPKSDPLFPRPRTSLLAWDALLRPSAEPSPADAPPSKGTLSVATG